jgi:hypothetical protein
MKKTNNNSILNNINIKLLSTKNSKKSNTVSEVDLKKQLKVSSKKSSKLQSKTPLSSNTKLKSISLNNKKTSLKKVINASPILISKSNNNSSKNYRQSNDNKLKTSKTVSKKYILKGGGNIITESLGMIKTMKALGNSIFKEIHDITRIGHDINNVASSDPLPNENTKTTNVQTPDL